MTSEDSSNENEEAHADSSRYSTRRMTFEEWNRAATAANPLDSYLKSKEEFEKTEPPIEAIKFYRRERTYYLLNRGDTAIDRLQYRAVQRDVNTKRVSKTARYEVTGIPPRFYFEIGEMDLEGETRMQVEPERVEWADGGAFQEPRRLQLFQPSADAAPPLDTLDLRSATADPAVIDSGDT